MLDPRTSLLVKRLAVKYQLSAEQVENIKNSMFKFINITINNLDLSKVESKEDMESHKTNFNIPRIGKLYASYGRLSKFKNRKK